MVGHCDVTEPATIDAVFAAVQKAWGALDFVVHAIAFSDKDRARRPLRRHHARTTSPSTMLISCYSFTAIAQRAEKLMPNGGSLLTLTYYGAEKWMPHYNVMGVAKAALEASVRYLAADLGAKNIRVNAISSGPIKTLAASGIGDFRYILKWNEYNAPLRRNVTLEEVGDAALYLLSDLSRGVTGEIHHVDAGYHIVGMKHPDAPDIDGRQGLSSGRHVMPRPFSISSATARPTGTPSAGCRASTTSRSTRSAAARRSHCGEILRDLFARDGVDRRRSRLCVEPARPRPRDHGADAHGTGPPPDGYRIDPRLMEMPFGRWEGFTFAELQDREAEALAAARARQVGLRAAGRRELCERLVGARARSGTTASTRDMVVAAHGGVARGLIAHLGIAAPAAAPLVDIGQGVVYVFRGNAMTRYA